VIPATGKLFHDTEKPAALRLRTEGTINLLKPLTVNSFGVLMCGTRKHGTALAMERQNHFLTT
jgi:hypothetical protein